MSADRRLHNLSSHIVAANPCGAMAQPGSPLTTHVLNTAMGVPGSNMTILLYKQDSSAAAWNLITTGITNSDGRCPGLTTRELFTPGVYKLHFDTDRYWGCLGEESFYPYVEIVFTIRNPVDKFHIPLLLSRFSYSTYRGS
ncbi:5-hydroxyisourate hydrolase [Gadus macrocephalus]|uniref:5-hydroxyisourate hydrolase n=1 Tax=Gadus macrocephalus TaxID=80720 RepID=UPI0028CBACE8|nr:5-hydroxyisourate hydrolase [Gadus macrocephalus]